MNAILIDDESKATKILQNMLEEFCPQVNIVATADSATKALSLINSLQPDLLFLDVMMPEVSGFDLLRQLPNLDVEVIFVTSYDSFALDAIKFCAIGYILKPIRESELIIAVNKAQIKINEKKENLRNKQLLQNLINPNSPNNKIGIPTSRGLEFMEAGSIIRCEGIQRCTKVVSDQNSILSSYNLGEFRKLLESYNFYAPHKSHLISLDHIVRYDKEGFIEMSDNEQIPVSRRRRQEFLEKMTRL